MRQIFDGITYLVGDPDTLEKMQKAPALPLFAGSAFDFLEHLSNALMHDKRAREFPDIISYAFWIRRAHLESVRNSYQSKAQKLGRGIAYQIAPSNIPVQFAVSMTYALCAGNASIIRVSSRQFAQVEIICDAINSLLRDECAEISPYICIVRYGHDEKITQALTDLCDIRMIWGGDKTVDAIRKCPVKPRCIDIGFADRYSIAVIDSDEYLKKDSDALANDFYNDTYFSDQNACSSPRLVIWIGERTSEARELFWAALEKVAERKYAMDPIISSEKLLNTAVLAAKYPGIREIKRNNLLVRIQLPKLYENIMDYKGNCGYFFEYCTDDLESIVPLLKKECQTVSYIGNVEHKIRTIISEHGARGVDRVVAVGRASDISFVWDGLDLPDILSRQVGRD